MPFLTSFLLAIITGALGVWGLSWLRGVSRASRQTRGRPYCRRCGYELTGMLREISPGCFEARGICTECASELEDDTIRFGRPEPAFAAPIHLACICLLLICASMSCLSLSLFPAASACRRAPLGVITSPPIQRMWPRETLDELRSRLANPAVVDRAPLAALFDSIADGHSSMPMPHQLEILVASLRRKLADEDLARYARASVAPTIVAANTFTLYETPNASDFARFDLRSTISLRWRPERMRIGGRDVLFARAPLPRRGYDLLYPRTCPTAPSVTLDWVSNVEITGEAGCRPFVLEHHTQLMLDTPPPREEPMLTLGSRINGPPPVMVSALVTGARFDAQGAARGGLSHWALTAPSPAGTDIQSAGNMAARVTLILDGQLPVPLGILVAIWPGADTDPFRERPPVIYESRLELSQRIEAQLSTATKAELLIESDAELEDLYLPTGRVWRGTYLGPIDIVRLGDADTQLFQGWLWSQ